MSYNKKWQDSLRCETPKKKRKWCKTTGKSPQFDLSSTPSKTIPPTTKQVDSHVDKQRGQRPVKLPNPRSPIVVSCKDGTPMSFGGMKFDAISTAESVIALKPLHKQRQVKLSNPNVGSSKSCDDMKFESISTAESVTAPKSVQKLRKANLSIPKSPTVASCEDGMPKSCDDRKFESTSTIESVIALKSVHKLRKANLSNPKSPIVASCEDAMSTSCDDVKFESISTAESRSSPKPVQKLRQVKLSNPRSPFCGISKSCDDMKVKSISTDESVIPKPPPKPVKEPTHASRMFQQFATYLKAFALIYVLPQEEWTGDIIGRLLSDSDEFFHGSSEDDVDDGPRYGSSICSIQDKCIKRSFLLEGHNFSLELRPPYMGDERKSMDLRVPHILKNLKPVLSRFFRNAHYCLLILNDVYLLIWHRRKTYYVMNVKRPQQNQLEVDKKRVELLDNLSSLNQVVEIVGKLSGDNVKGNFVIREMVVVRLVTPDGRTFLRESKVPYVDYKVVDKDYAFLKSNLHLSLNPKSHLHNKSSVVVGVAGIIASHIDHPASWNTDTFDRLICYGVDICRSCWSENMQEELPMVLEKFPTRLRLGQFQAEIKLQQCVRVGLWHSGNFFKGNDFDYEIQQILHEYGNALFQINTQIYALWCKDNFYYLLDPYRHMVTKHVVNVVGSKSDKVATVRMFRELSTMLNVFHRVLMESNRHAVFHIHTVRIINLIECPEDKDVLTPSVNTNSVPSSLPEQLASIERGLIEVSGYEPDLSPLAFVEFDKGLVEQPQLDAVTVETLKRPRNTQATQTKLRCISSKRKSICALSKPRSISPSENSRRPASKSCSSMNSRQVPHKSYELSQLRARNTTTDKRQAGAMKATSSNAARKTNVTFNVNSTNDHEGNRSEGGSEHKSPTKGTPVSPVLIAKKASQLKCQAAISQDEPAGDVNKFLDCDTFHKLDAEYNAKYLPMKLEQVCLGKCNHSVTSYSTTGEPHPNSVIDRESSILKFPVYSKYPHNLAIAGSESGTMESLDHLLSSAFKVTNRVLAITPWGSYVVFKHSTQNQMGNNSIQYFLFDGCTCNIDRFRHLDLSNGTAGLRQFESQEQVVCFMIDAREMKAMKLLRNCLDSSAHVSEKCTAKLG